MSKHSVLIGSSERAGAKPAHPDRERTMLRSATQLSDVETGPLVVETTYADFDDFWQPLTLGVGPAVAYCTSLAPHQREGGGKGRKTKAK